MGPAATLGQFLTTLSKASGSTERIQELMQEPEEDFSQGTVVDVEGQTLQVESVEFGYDDDQTILHDLSFEAKPNTVVAFAGPSGGGKSTIFSLLERYYEPRNGTIKIGETPINSVALADWRKQIGFVSQDSAIMSGTIRDNLTYGLTGEYSDAQLWAVLQLAFAEKFVREMPEGLNTEVGTRGIKVSGGQRQRLAIARAFLRDPKILMLDEATASLDSESEAMVQKALEILMEGRTTLVIAHRLSTIVDADQIYFIENGHVSGAGKQLVPRIPEAFLLIAMGWGLSFMPVFHNFKLEPEFFMLLIIAPLMFIDGQKQSFANIRKRFQGIFLLSVVLAVVTAVVVGLITKQIEAQWTFPLALALAVIVTPTDAVAVKSMTGSNEMPKGVGEALELESLFNDATGLVLLDLALSVLSKGTFSVVQGIGHFLFVAVGGVVIGIIGGFLLVMLRFNLNRHGKNPELTTIPISLLTPFAIYLLAEHFGVSGILAVVATGIEHNWEADRLRLTSTNVQLTSRTIWSVLSGILNDFVFLILGISLPEVARNVT